MPKIVLFSFLLFVVSFAKSQEIDANRYAEAFEAAYFAHPNVPRGMLEAVAFAQTRIHHKVGNHAGCSGIPQVSGVMGLTEDGKGYFNNNLTYVSDLSGISVARIKASPADNIMAYAAAYSSWIERIGASPEDFVAQDQILKSLSEIPSNTNAASDYALNCFTYEVFKFLNNPTFQTLFGLPDRSINLVEIYGAENLAVLSSNRITISKTDVLDENYNRFRRMDRSAEYGPAIWNAAPSCNYSSRGGTPISAVTVHTIQGSYAGAISWAQNCLSNVSYHYVARSSDGQITQMVEEADKAWHVGSANPYTIGIEHEGYVDDPVWYTEAMYVGSANLVKDITVSGYGINPLRTFKGPATAGTLTLGACTKIKGHQHFPGASHTDPGINWDWEHYYRLINDDPDVTVYTATSGTFYDSGGASEDYEDDERFLYRIQPAGATSVALSMISFDLEADWDYLYVYDGATMDAPLIDVYTGSDIPDVLTSSGSSILLEFRSDCSTTDAGWEIVWSALEGDGEGDELPPATAVLFDDDWATDDFFAGFEDTDDSLGSGVQYRFYQVIDFDGTEWRGNSSRGFFSDNYDVVIHPEWTTATGSWLIADESLLQNDEGLSNTNIYASLNQTDEEKFLFHWSGKISGMGTNKRAGFHFMCDDATLPNRGNSYFVWFRVDDNKVQFYKVEDDVFTLTAESVYDFAPDIWYDFKTVYDKELGVMHAWVNNVHVLSWEDLFPLVSGNAVSFRSGNALYNVNNFKVYHGRGEDAAVLVGPAGDARYQNTDPFTPAAKVKSIVIDSAFNVSGIASQLVDVDWTAPLPIGYLNDGSAADIATTTSNTELQANWAITSDPNSGIASYWYAIGTSPGATDVVDWTDNWYADTVRHTGLDLILGETYYFAVTAENGAGLFSDTIFSDGQLLVEPTEPPVAYFTADHTNLCGLDSVKLENGSTDALSYEWSIPDGIPSFSVAVNPYVTFASSGMFEVRLVATGPGGSDTIYQVLGIEINDPPVALFTPSADVVYLADPIVTFVNNSLYADGYYWNFGDASFSTDESPWHSYAATGDYTVSLIAINGDCPNDSVTALISVLDVDGIDEFDPTHIFVYPNPASDFVQILGLNSVYNNANYEVFDTRGRLILSGNLIHSASGNQIGIQSLSKGVYQLKITVKNQYIIRQLVVE